MPDILPRLYYFFSNTTLKLFLFSLVLQVDPSYLARKQYGGPSEDDNKVLYAPDPLVERSLYFGSAKKFNTECGLYCDTDKNTLQTTFRHEVNVADILGHKNILSEIRRGEEAMKTFHVNYVLDSMISSSTVHVM